MVLLLKYLMSVGYKIIDTSKRFPWTSRAVVEDLIEHSSRNVEIHSVSICQVFVEKLNNFGIVHSSHHSANLLFCSVTSFDCHVTKGQPNHDGIAKPFSIINIKFHNPKMILPSYEPNEIAHSFAIALLFSEFWPLHKFSHS